MENLLFRVARPCPLWRCRWPQWDTHQRLAQDAGGDIVVTGSRIGRTSFNSPTPVNVLGQQRAQDLNITDVGDALNQIPAFRPLTSPATNSFRAGSNIAGRSLDLRGLGPTRTLTLIDGRRHVASSDDGTFDLNSIPSIMVQRSEVVTGGASAAYGADAVAGVVNLILDTKLNGLKAETSYGETKYGDGVTRYIALAGGHDFAGDRGHFVFGGESSNDDQVGTTDTRPWGKKHHNFVTNPFWNANPALSNGLPANVGADNVNALVTPWGAVTTASPFQGQWFDDTGNLVPFQFGDLYNRTKPSANMIGGDPRYLTNYGAQGSPYVVAVKHYSMLGHVDFDLTPKTVLSAELSYAKVDGGPTGSNARSDANGAITIRRDNGYLNPSVAARMDMAGVTTIPVSRINLEPGPNVYSSTNETWNSLIAAKGELFADWKWDAAYQFGQTKGLQSNASGRVDQRWKDAIDAVKAPAGFTGPTYDGGIICRTSIANPSNGCIPANIMGPNKVSPAAAKWVNAQPWSNRTYTDNVFSANVRGTLLQGWAGPISAAAGAEYRITSAEGDADPLSKTPGVFSQTANTPLPKIEQKVTEGYVEFGVPLLKDLPFVKSLDFDGAARRTNYSISGAATTWKLGLEHEINDEYMLRVTRSHDIRAPVAAELNPNRNTLDVQLTDPGVPGQVSASQYFISTLNGGDPNLKLEQADTFTAGVVVQPHWFPGLKLSFDYYDIKVEDAIDLPSSAVALAICRAGTDPGICTIGVDRTGTPNRVVTLVTTYRNINELNAVGKEFVANYSKDLSEISDKLSGTISTTFNASIINTLSTVLPNGTVREYSNFLGNTQGSANTNGVPRWRGDAIITYSQPSYSLTAHVSYIPDGIQNPDWIGPSQPGYSVNLPNSVNDNTVSSRTYLDLSGRVKVYGKEDHKIELFGGVNNVFDTDPPEQLVYNGNPLYYSPLGRNYKVGLRANW